MKKSSITSIASLHLSDFGTAVLKEKYEYQQGKVGSPSHMAPEVFNEERGYDSFAADSNEINKSF